MAKRSMTIRVAIVGIIVVIALMSGSLLEAIAGSQAQSRSMPPAVTAIPNTGVGGAKMVCYGANFEPGETVKVVYLVLPGVENVLGSKAKGLALKVNELGSFDISSNLPKLPGIYPIRVYDKDENMIAATVVVVKAKKKKKKK